MSDEFVIKQETLPVRCEVCHQVDFFDPETNHCVRCFAVLDHQGEGSTFHQTQFALSRWQGYAVLGSLYGLPFGIFGLFWSFSLFTWTFNLASLLLFFTCLFMVVSSVLILIGLGIAWFVSTQKLISKNKKSD